MLKSIFVTAAIVALLAAPDAVRAGESKDIVDTAVAAGNFKTLASALTAARLVDTLKARAPSPSSRPRKRRSRRSPRPTSMR